MVAFNPDIGDLPSPGMPDQTGASRGSIPNQGFEALFKGAGNIIEGAVGLADSTVQTFIKEDVRAGYDAELKPITDSVPIEMQNGVASLGSLQAALEQGKISDVYFYGQLTAMSKSMRAKYPGYEEYVDNAIQSITGVRPANALRDAILSEQARKDSATNQEENKWDTWEKQNEAIILQLFPDYFTNTSKYDRTQIRQGVAAKKAELAQIDQINTETSMLINQGKLTDDQAKEAAMAGLNQFSNTYMTSASNALGFNGPDTMKMIAQMQKEGATDEEYAALLAQMNQVEGQLRYGMMQYLNQTIPGTNTSYAQILGNDPNAIDNLVSTSMTQFNAIKEMITNKEFGLASYYTNLNSMSSSRNLNTILNADPELATLNALKEISPDLVDTLLTQSGKQERINQLIPELIARQAHGSDSFEDQAARIATSNLDTNSKSSSINQLVNDTLTGIKSGQLTPEQFANMVEGAYGYEDDSRSTIFELVNPNDRSTLYNRMYNPEVTAAVIKTGDSQALMTYYESAVENIFGIPELRRASGTVEQMQDWTSRLKITQDPTSGRIVLDAGELMSNMPATGAGAAMTTQKLKTLQEGIDNLNNTFAILSPILDGMGVSDQLKSGVYADILNQLNVDLEDGKKDGFFDWLGKSLGDLMSSVDDSLDEIDPNTGIRMSVGAGVNNEDYSSISGLIKEFEGFRETPYWDVNANRAGYGSDTITAADGSHRRVTPDDIVTQEDADRDLERRLNSEFIPEIVDDIGSDVWNGLSANTKAALTSIAYNYGSLPSRVIKAAKGGDPESLAVAIEQLQTHNGGVNRKRRLKEADLVRSG